MARGLSGRSEGRKDTLQTAELVNADPRVLSQSQTILVMLSAVAKEKQTKTVANISFIN